MHYRTASHSSYCAWVSSCPLFLCWPRFITVELIPNRECWWVGRARPRHSPAFLWLDKYGYLSIIFLNTFPCYGTSKSSLFYPSLFRHTIVSSPISMQPSWYSSQYDWENSEGICAVPLGLFYGPVRCTTWWRPIASMCSTVRLGQSYALSKLWMDINGHRTLAVLHD